MAAVIRPIANRTLLKKILNSLFPLGLGPRPGLRRVPGGGLSGSQPLPRIGGKQGEISDAAVWFLCCSRED